MINPNIIHWLRRLRTQPDRPSDSIPIPREFKIRSVVGPVVPPQTWKSQAPAANAVMDVLVELNEVLSIQPLPTKMGNVYALRYSVERHAISVVSEAVDLKSFISQSRINLEPTQSCEDSFALMYLFSDFVASVFEYICRHTEVRQTVLNTNTDNVQFMISAASVKMASRNRRRPGNVLVVRPSVLRYLDVTPSTSVNKDGIIRKVGTLHQSPHITVYVTSALPVDAMLTSYDPAHAIDAGMVLAISSMDVQFIMNPRTFSPELALRVDCGYTMLSSDPAFTSGADYYHTFKFEE